MTAPRNIITRQDRELANCLNELAAAAEPLLSRPSGDTPALRLAMVSARMKLDTIQLDGMATALHELLEQVERLSPTDAASTLATAVTRSRRALKPMPIPLGEPVDWDEHRHILG